MDEKHNSSALPQFCAWTCLVLVACAKWIPPWLCGCDTCPCGEYGDKSGEGETSCCRVGERPIAAIPSDSCFVADCRASLLSSSSVSMSISQDGGGSENDLHDVPSKEDCRSIGARSFFSSTFSDSRSSSSAPNVSLSSL